MNKLIRCYLIECNFFNPASHFVIAAKRLNYKHHHLTLKNQQAIKLDIQRNLNKDTEGLSGDEIDLGLQCVITLLVEGTNNNINVNNKDGHHYLQLASMITQYFIDRLCVPRDMGVLSANTIRSLHRWLRNNIHQNKYS